MKKFTLMDFSKMIDHTNLSPIITTEEIENLCQEAIDINFHMVAVNQLQVALCKKKLIGTNVAVGAAISFPFGQTTIESKMFETRNAIKFGATEIDYVIAISELKNKNYNYLKKEMLEIVDLCNRQQVISKVIFENSYLTKDEIAKMSAIAKDVRPDFIKTSTGFSDDGAKLEDVRLMKRNVGEYVKIKAAGGIRNKSQFKKMIESGADRIGTTSGRKIITELAYEMKEKKQEYIEINR